MYRKYFVYIDDGKDVFKIAIAATSEASAANLCAGQGEIISIKDVTDDYHIDVTEVRKALVDARFNLYAADFVCRALTELELAG